MILHVVRHCKTDFNEQHRCQGTTDLPLNSTGRAQARAIAARFAGRMVDAVYASPYKRAVGTAQQIADDKNLKIKTDERLAELDQGDLEGLDMKTMGERYPDLIARWFKNPADTPMPGGSETMRDVQDRIGAAIEKIVADNPQSSEIVVVSHNLAIGALACKLLGLEIDDFRKFKISTGSVTTVEFKHSRSVVLTLNDVSHLNGEYD